MFATNHSQGNLPAGMPTSPEMDALFDAFQAAESEDDQREIMGKIQAEWNELVPALAFAPSAEFLMWSKQVPGVVDSTNSLVLLQDAWISGGDRKRGVSGKSESVGVAHGGGG